MNMSINTQIAALEAMAAKQLRDRYLEVFGEPSRSGNVAFLRKRIAWRIQSLAEGTLSERARKRAAEIVREADIRVRTPRPASTSDGATTVTVRSNTRGHHGPTVGTILTRQYRGKLVQVTVLPNGFDYDGQVYRSLSAVAKAITGSHWSGNLFFGLNKDDNE